MTAILKALLFAAFAASSLSGDEEAGFVPLFDGKTLQGWKSAKSKGDGDSGPFSVNAEEKAIHVYAGEEQGSKQENECLVSDKEFAAVIVCTYTLQLVL